METWNHVRAVRVDIARLQKRPMEGKIVFFRSNLDHSYDRMAYKMAGGRGIFLFLFWI